MKKKEREKEQKKKQGNIVVLIFEGKSMVWGDLSRGQ